MATLFLMTLEKCFKYSRDLILRNSRPGVRELKHKTCRSRPGSNRYNAVYWREFDRIGEQVIENGTQLLAISVYDEEGKQIDLDR